MMNVISLTKIFNWGSSPLYKTNPSVKTEGRLKSIFGVHCVFRTLHPINTQEQGR